MTARTPVAPAMSLNDRRLALEFQKLMDRRIDIAIRNRLTNHRYGVVDGAPDTVKRTVAVRLNGLPNPSPGFVYGSGLAPRDGDFVRVRIDPRGDRWVDDVLGRDVVSEIVDVVTPPVVQPDRALGALAQVLAPGSGSVPTLTNWIAYGSAFDAGSVIKFTGGSFSTGAEFTATAGRLLVVIADGRASTMPVAPAGWTKLAPEINVGYDGMAVYVKVATGGETDCPLLGGCTDWAAFEFASGAVSSVSVTAHTAQGPASTWTSPGITPPAGIPAHIIGAITGHDDTWLGTGAPTGAWVERGDFGARGNHPHSYFMSQAIASTSGTYTPTVNVSSTIGGTSHVFDGLTILISGAATSDVLEPAPEVIDQDDATYHLATLSEAVRVDLLAPYRIVRARIVIGCSSAGAKSYELRGANLGDYSDEVVLAPLDFTAAGSFAAAVLTPVWPSTTPYRFYRIVGPAEDRRVFTVELYETTAGSTPVIDPTTGLGAEIDDALAALLAAALAADITDHGALTGLGDDDHPQYLTEAEADALYDPLGSGVTDHGGLTGLGDDDHALYALNIRGGEIVRHAHGNLGATSTIDLENGNYHTGTLNADCTIGFAGFTAGTYGEVGFRLAQTGTGGWVPTFTGVTWIGGTAPTFPTAPSTSCELVFWSDDGGTTIYGGMLGSGTVTGFATPALTLSTSNAAGSATTAIRSDATVAAFDATAPTTSAVGDAAATGSAGKAARRDHAHGREGFGAPVAVGSANADGTATTVARSDHVHQGASGADDHIHIVGEALTSDGVATSFLLANEAIPNTVAAYDVAGARKAVTLGGMNDQITFASTPGTGTFLVDYVPLQA